MRTALRACQAVWTSLPLAAGLACKAPAPPAVPAAQAPAAVQQPVQQPEARPLPAAPALLAPEGLRVQTTLLGTFDVHWRSEPAALERGKVFALRAWVTPHGSREVVPWTTLGVDADMPEHLHGMNRVPRVSRQADGSFLVEGMLFHMPGRWNLYFDVHEAAIVERAQLELELE